MSALRSDSLNSILARLLVREAGYVNDPKDPGGETNLGISKRSYPNEDIKALTPERAADIYYRDFYLAPQLYKLPDDRVEAVFDLGVNAGPGQAIRTMQRALRVTADGQLGPQTLTAVTTIPLRDFQKAFLLERLLFYVSTILARPTSIKYARGWMRRALEFI